MSANNASTGNSYLEKATGYAQSALGTVTGSSADKAQAEVKKDNAELEHDASKASVKVPGGAITSSGIAKDNEDQMTGNMKQTGGSAKEFIGNLTGSESLKQQGRDLNKEGQGQEAKGILSQGYEGVKDRVGGTIGQGINSMLGNEGAAAEYQKQHDAGKTNQRGFEANIDKKAEAEAEAPPGFSNLQVLGFAAASRRHGSSLPGPLESRRRQNKRRMGELTFGHTHGSAPLWHLENLPDLSQWQWKPPTARGTRQTAQAEKKLWKAVLAWLSPRDEAQSQSVNEASTTASPGALRNAMPVTTVDPSSIAAPTPVLGSDTNPTSLAEQSFNALIQDASRDRTFQICPVFSSFCDTLRDSLSTGQISAQALYNLVPSISDVLVRSALAMDIQQEAPVFDRLKAQVIWASIDGLEALSARLGDLPFDTNIWSMLLQETSRLRFNSLRTFARLMSLVPSDAIGSLRDVICTNLNNSLNAMGQATHRTHERQINKLAAAIQELGRIEHRYVLEEVLLDLTQCAQSPNYIAMRFCWLQVLARLRNLDDEFLADSCVLLEAGISAEPLESKQIARIFLGRLNNRYSPRHVTKLYSSLMGAHESRCFGQLSASFWCTNQARYIKSLCTFLLRMGRHQDIMQLLNGVVQLVQNEATPLANLAIGLRHPELALEIYVRYCKSTFASKKFWQTGFAGDILKVMSESKSLELKRIIAALRMFPMKRGRRSYPLSPGGVKHGAIRRVPRGLRIEQVQKAEAAAVAFASARNIPDSMSFRLVQQCVNYIRSHGAKVSPKGLEALWRATTKDLVNNRPGRASRLRWFLRVLFKERGLKETRAAHLQLVQWRNRVLSKPRSSNWEK
ncbi:uncharacterized protein PG998_001272 [Apiospora kogelbergensis]|uniref:uncharacterized protein n=1 Tax=Apiospora kogelbergensis TaxID=1337665 RepID=UPI0031324C9C